MLVLPSVGSADDVSLAGQGADAASVTCAGSFASTGSRSRSRVCTRYYKGPHMQIGQTTWLLVLVRLIAWSADSLIANYALFRHMKL